MKITLETSGEDVKNTLEKCGEDVKITLETSGEDVKTTLKTGGKDVKNTPETSVNYQAHRYSNPTFSTTLETSVVLWKLTRTRKCLASSNL